MFDIWRFPNKTFFLSEVSENLHSIDVEPVEDKKGCDFLNEIFVWKSSDEQLANAGGWSAM